MGFRSWYGPYQLITWCSRCFIPEKSPVNNRNAVLKRVQNWRFRGIILSPPYRTHLLAHDKLFLADLSILFLMIQHAVFQCE